MKVQQKHDVKVTDLFWSRYIDLVKEKVIPYQWEALNDRVEGAAPSHAIKNFKIAAGEETGEFHGFVFQDSDLAKWIEAVAYILKERPDPELEATCDDVIALVKRAQQPDGYLNTYYTIKEPNKRWTNLRDNHELYVGGHFIEAAVAYFEATGKRQLLDVMCRFADYVDSVFGYGEDQLRGYDGHQEIELALLKLYRVTKEERYLRLSQFFIDIRGEEPHFFDQEAVNRGEKPHRWYRNSYSYSQSHKPVREQEVAAGHSVRAVYMYTAMADLANELDDDGLKKTCETLWKNVTEKQMYITAGIGSAEFGESFTSDYDLPNDLAYTETCASIGLVFWAKKMLELEPKGSYADVIERAIYNGTISGIELDGTKFFYVNPLEVWPNQAAHRHDYKHVKSERQPWFGCACCPPNIARMIASIGQYVYSVKDQIGFVHLYIGSQTTLELDEQKVRIQQESEFPWHGSVSFKIDPEHSFSGTLAFRIPGWAHTFNMSINGEELSTQLVDGYAYVTRTWEKADELKLSIPMDVNILHPHPKLRANAGKVALQRGPVVYCLEEVDNSAGLSSLAIKDDQVIEHSFDQSTLGGVVVLKGKARRTENLTNALYVSNNELVTKEVDFKAIPYYAWANRGIGEMAVWNRKA
ncbi:glycoside hydrolase family 127 protein [Alkalicoccobacillus porphyridii]|uniref:Glycoside hydrolase family 127 protein n=1 Tax=Alkalicoccobacillus porphyridii TaxID=2597270 RepID=A0A553ZWZ6_9BACI|nr:beta-L-arabinofuranosidase domain-containing protein [Alkalicoccobacillus porphyridii]TSB45988.1 glycoside hydrolase family 127 protein [Alkalicoccobacillus porphyridii]